MGSHWLVTRSLALAGPGQAGRQAKVVLQGTLGTRDLSDLPLHAPHQLPAQGRKTLAGAVRALTINRAAWS